MSSIPLCGSPKPGGDQAYNGVNDDSNKKTRDFQKVGKSTLSKETSIFKQLPTGGTSSILVQQQQNHDTQQQQLSPELSFMLGGSIEQSKTTLNNNHKLQQHTSKHGQVPPSTFQQAFIVAYNRQSRT